MASEQADVEARRVEQLLLAASNPDDRPTYQKDAIDSEFAGCDGSAVKFRRAAANRWQSDSSINSTWSLHAAHQESQTDAQKQTGSAAKTPSSLFSRFTVTSPLVSSELPQASTASTASAGPETVEPMGTGVEVMGTQVKPMGTRVEHEDDTVSSWQALALEVMREEKADALGNSQELGLGFTADDSDDDTASTALAGIMADAGRRSAQAASPLAEIVMLPGGRFFVLYEVLTKLGEGAFGEAYKARRRKDGRHFCVKMYHADTMTEKDKEDVKNEAKILATLNHPNIVRYQETYTDNRDGRLILVMELAEEGDLQQALRDREGQLLPEDDVMLCFVQLCMGILHIHDRGIIHRDLKCCNTFVGAGGLLKLGDFGIAKAVAGSQPATGTVVGTPSFMSPELIQGHKYDAKTDIWALGCILYELCTLRKAFEAVNMAAIMIKILSGKVPPLPPVFSKELQSLLSAMLQRQPALRPSIREVLQMEIVKRHLARYEQLVRQGQSTRRVSIIAALRTAGAPAPDVAEALTSRQRFRREMSVKSALHLCQHPQLVLTLQEQEDAASLVLPAPALAGDPCEQADTRASKAASTVEETLQQVEEQPDPKAAAEARLTEQLDARAKLRAYKAQLRSRRPPQSTGEASPAPESGVLNLVSPQARKSMATLLQDLQSLQVAGTPAA